MTSYLSLPVLEIEPNRKDGFEDTSSWEQDTIDFDVGLWKRDTVRTTAQTQHDFLFSNFSREEMSGLRDFFNDRQGAYLPFWIPSWNRDMTLWGSHAGGTDTLVINDIGYASHGFPTGIHARKHLAISKVTGGARVWRYCGVAGAVDNGNGSEIVTLMSNLDLDLTVEEADICFLLYGRFASDTLTLPWHNEVLSEASITVIELPTEVPAPA